MTVKHNASTEQVTPATGGLSWKASAYLIGALIGLFLGLLTAYLYVRASEESASKGPTKIKTGDAMKLSLALLTLIRQITEIGSKS